MDLVLLIELVLYSFAMEEWQRIRNLLNWQQQVQKSESLAYAVWIENLLNYWNARGQGSTWLTVQCNITNPWTRAAL
jgi:hypothetical protein